MPKISIITPIYADIPEKIEWLHEAIDSVLSQTFEDWEMIIIDDKSTFELERTRYLHEHRIRWFKTGDQSGPATVRNTAVALAESEAILPLDADDKLTNGDVLEKLYSAWVMDQTKVIYGNLTQLVNVNSTYQQGKTFVLADYTFDRAMNLNGVMPITALHSIKCWQAVGGWNSTLDAGLEDVEYWLAAGKAGYCGLKINEPVLMYRQQQESRTYYLKNVDNRFTEMQQKIKTIHNDVFEGRFPMGCCGKGNNDQPAMAMQSNSKITTLEGYDANELVWMEYNGGRNGKFSIHVRSPNPNIEYTVMGNGHKFQVHRHHIQRLGRMRGFNVTTEPVIIKTEEPKQADRYTGSEPQLAVIERLDRIAADSLGLDLPSVNELPQLEPEVTNGKEYQLSDLDIGRFEGILGKDHWTVEKLALADQDDLINYPQVGPARAAAIISKAQELINQT